MTSAALNNPKVRFELGNGGAPKEAGKCLDLLKEAHREGTAELQPMGYNGINAFDLELSVAEPKLEMSDKEKI